MLRAAFELIAEGHGLTRLGLTREAICGRSGEQRGTYDHHFGPNSRRDLRTELVNRFHERLVADAVANRKLYELGADALEHLSHKGAARAIIGAAVLHDARTFDPANMDTEAQGRDRLYYLMLALCGLPTSSTGVDYPKHLRAASDEQQQVYQDVYHLFSEITGREFVAGLDRTQRAINAYLEGVLALRRFGAAPSDDEIIDTVLRLFLITTKRKGRPDIDVDEEALPGR